MKNTMNSSFKNVVVILVIPLFFLFLFTPLLWNTEGGKGSPCTQEEKLLKHKMDPGCYHRVTNSQAIVLSSFVYVFLVLLSFQVLIGFRFIPVYVFVKYPFLKTLLLNVFYARD
jgi:hypothetical protein